MIVTEKLGNFGEANKIVILMLTGGQKDLEALCVSSLLEKLESQYLS